MSVVSNIQPGLNIFESINHTKKKEAAFQERKPLSEKFIKSHESLGIRSKLNDDTKQKTTFEIFKDPNVDRCKSCGVVKQAYKTFQSVSTQTLPKEISDLILAKPSYEYWESLAEERRKALAETLNENQELCSLVERLSEQLEKYSSKFQAVKTMINDHDLDNLTEDDGSLL